MTNWDLRMVVTLSISGPFTVRNVDWPVLIAHKNVFLSLKTLSVKETLPSVPNYSFQLIIQFYSLPSLFTKNQYHLSAHA